MNMSETDERGRMEIRQNSSKASDFLRDAVVDLTGSTAEQVEHKGKCQRFVQQRLQSWVSRWIQGWVHRQARRRHQISVSNGSYSAHNGH